MQRALQRTAKGGLVVRVARASLSSKPSPVEKTEAEGRFVSQRVKYKEQLTSMRKKWTEEIEERNAQIAREKAAEKERVVLAKAIRLREKRKQSVVRQAADKAAKVAAGVRFKEHLANNLRVYSDRKNSSTAGTRRWHQNSRKSPSTGFPLRTSTRKSQRNSSISHLLLVYS